jgi:hypothetical protein
MPNRDDADRACLLRLAELIAARLRGSSHLILEGRRRLRETETGGWLVPIGRLRRDRATYVDLWLDHWFGPNRDRVVWCGFFWPTIGSYRRALGRWDRRINQSRQIGANEVQTVDGIFTLREARRYRTVLLERYPPQYYLGQYASRPGDRPEYSAVAARMARFVDAVIDDAGAVSTERFATGFLRAPSRHGVPLRSDYAEIQGYVRKAKSVRVRNIHARMVRALERLLPHRHLEMSTLSGAPFDVRVRNHDGRGRHLLIEVKALTDPMAARLAVGQLLDYRRHISERKRTDLAVLFPRQPGREVREFLRDVGIQARWFLDGRLRRLSRE